MSNEKNDFLYTLDKYYISDTVIYYYDEFSEKLIIIDKSDELKIYINIEDINKFFENAELEFS